MSSNNYTLSAHVPLFRQVANPTSPHSQPQPQPPPALHAEVTYMHLYISMYGNLTQSLQTHYESSQGSKCYPFLEAKESTKQLWGNENPSAIENSSVLQLTLMYHHGIINQSLGWMGNTGLLLKRRTIVKGERSEKKNLRVYIQPFLCNTLLNHKYIYISIYHEESIIRLGEYLSIW